MKVIVNGLRPPPDGPLPKLPGVASRILLREEADWDQKEAARHLGVSVLTFWYWEHGRRTPRPDHLRAYYSLLYSWQESIREYAGTPKKEDDGEPGYVGSRRENSR